MSYTELNTVEYFIISELTGVNLNQPNWKEPVTSYGLQWQYKSVAELKRSIQEVLVEEDLKAALIRLNPEIGQQPERAEEVLHKLRAILIAVSHTGLVRANEAFIKWLQGEEAMPFGEDNRHVPVRLIDFDNPASNTFVRTNGDLGRKMRSALLNAFLFGLTGTPINKGDRNTFWAFGAEEDERGYLSRYSFQDSIRDKATLKLHFEPRLLDVHADKETIDKVFAEQKEAAALSDEQADVLIKKSAKMAAFLKSPERIETIVKDIIHHFYEKVDPYGFKAMIVTPDRLACVQYKEALDKYLPTEASAVVISTSANDDCEFKRKNSLDKDQQEKLIEHYDFKGIVGFVAASRRRYLVSFSRGRPQSGRF